MLVFGGVYFYIYFYIAIQKSCQTSHFASLPAPIRGCRIQLPCCIACLSDSLLGDEAYALQEAFCGTTAPPNRTSSMDVTGKNSKPQEILTHSNLAKSIRWRGIKTTFSDKVILTCNDQSHGDPSSYRRDVARSCFPSLRLESMTTNYQLRTKQSEDFWTTLFPKLPLLNSLKNKLTNRETNSDQLRWEETNLNLKNQPQKLVHPRHPQDGTRSAVISKVTSRLIEVRTPSYPFRIGHW